MELYEALSQTYDLMIDWPRRLRRESFLFRTVFRANKVERVLDVGCGTGMHARLFAQMGLKVTASDPVPAMIEATRRNLGGMNADLVVARFDETAAKCGGPFDCITCVGNSLPHVLTDDELRSSLTAIAAGLRDGGVVVIHGNNYDAIVENDERIMPLRSVRKGTSEYVFIRMFEGQAPVLTFHVLSLVKQGGDWSMSASKTQHRALLRRVLDTALVDAGFCHLEFYGAWDFSAFDARKSDHLIAIARKRVAGNIPAFREPVTAVNRVVIRDNGEPLVPVSSHAPSIVLGIDACLVRRTVASMLASAQARLPMGYVLNIMDAYRPVERQRRLYAQADERVRLEHPDWTRAQVRRAVNRYVAPADVKSPPGHSTGGAVDVRLCDAGGREVDMTSPFEFGMKGAATYSKAISAPARANREILIQAMSGVGFSNCADEWWHWSYGDSAWAARTGRHACCYGAVEVAVKSAEG